MLAHIVKLEGQVDGLRGEIAEARADIQAVAERLSDLPTKSDLDAVKLRWATLGLMAGVILAVGVVGVILAA